MFRSFQIARMAAGALLASPFRTMLTTLGIVIGITAVILLTALGGGVQRQITGQIGSLGANTIQINPGVGSTGGPLTVSTASTLTADDVRRVAALPAVAAVSPVIQASASFGGRAITLTGVDPAYAAIRTVTLDSGRFVATTGEIVLDATVAQALTGTTADAALGRTITLRDTPYTVVGITHVAPGGFGPQAQATTSYLHVADAQRIIGTTAVGQIVAQARDADSVTAATAAITTSLTAAHGSEDFSIATQQQLLATATQITSLLTYLLAGIAGISLVVGGIGIMNIMLVSVAERTREIGLRKALGATDGDVLLQFLLEAIFLSLGGGLIGVAAGVGLATLAPQLSSNLPTAITPGAVGLAFGVATAIGIIFGVLPAFRSARLQPVEALRYE